MDVCSGANPLEAANLVPKFVRRGKYLTPVNTRKPKQSKRCSINSSPVFPKAKRIRLLRQEVNSDNQLIDGLPSKSKSNSTSHTHSKEFVDSSTISNLFNSDGGDDSETQKKKKNSTFDISGATNATDPTALKRQFLDDCSLVKTHTEQNCCKTQHTNDTHRDLCNHLHAIDCEVVKPDASKLDKTPESNKCDGLSTCKQPAKKVFAVDSASQQLHASNDNTDLDIHLTASTVETTADPDNDKMGSINNKNTNSGSNSDDYCWICHKVGEVVICGCCPRVFHPTCLCVTEFPDIWLCPECQDLTLAECLLYQPVVWQNITKENLKMMLLFLVDRLSRHSWAEHFREPVDTELVSGYAEIIAYPMDLYTLYTRVKCGQYASSQAFIGDFRWILHNCIVFNGANSSLTVCARQLDETCHRELSLMRACPHCYLNRMPFIDVLPSTERKLPPLTPDEPASYLSNSSSPSKLSESPSPKSDKVDVLEECDKSNTNGDPWWFTNLCDVIHPLVWVRLQNYPRWPAKVMAQDRNLLLVSFFGDYDVTTAPIGSAQLHSEIHLKRIQRLVGRTDLVNDSHSNKQVDSANMNFLSSTRDRSSAMILNQQQDLLKPIYAPIIQTSYRQAVTELDHHLRSIWERYPDFKLPKTQIEFCKRYVKRFYGHFNTYRATRVDFKTSTNSTQLPVTQSTALKNHHLKIADAFSPSVFTNADLDSTSSEQPAYSNVSAYSEPVLKRIAASLLDVNSNTLFQNEKTEKSLTDHNYHDVAEKKHKICHTPSPSFSQNDSASDVKSKSTPGDVDCRIPSNSSPPDKFSALTPVPLALHPIQEPVSSAASAMDEINSALINFRSHFNESFKKLEDKWRFVCSSAHDFSMNLQEQPPLLHAVSADAGIQTESEWKSTSVRQPTCNKLVNTDINLIGKTLDNNMHDSSIESLQTRMMEAEIARLDQENQRLNLLVAFTRTEMAIEMRQRIIELRKIWNYEVEAILDNAGKIWEQDVITIVNAVKRKQWCAYCGRIAYFYCCWNTCYCNSVCQSKHWSVHINTCVQARSNLNGTSNMTQPCDSNTAVSINSNVSPRLPVPASNDPNAQQQQMINSRINNSILSPPTVNSSLQSNCNVNLAHISYRPVLPAIHKNLSNRPDL